MTEEVEAYDPDIDLDPNEAIERDYDSESDIDDAENTGNEQEGEAGEPVEGATPVDDSFESSDLPELDEEEDEDE